MVTDRNSDYELPANDPIAYQRGANRVTSDADADVWVVQESRGEDWRVSAVLTSYEDAEAYIEDARDFIENCPEDAPEDFCRRTVSFRLDGRKSPTSLYESWPPDDE